MFLGYCCKNKLPLLLNQFQKWCELGSQFSLNRKFFFSVQQFSFFGCGKKNLGGLRKPLQVQNENYANENEQKINAAPKNAITDCKKTKYPTLADLLKDEPIKPNVINIDITDEQLNLWM